MSELLDELALVEIEAEVEAEDNAYPPGFAPPKSWPGGADRPPLPSTPIA